MILIGYICNYKDEKLFTPIALCSHDNFINTFEKAKEMIEQLYYDVEVTFFRMQEDLCYDWDSDYGELIMYRGKEGS
jgi:hypothetical protein